MASLAAACRLSARLARRKLPHDAAARGFRTSAAALAAQNFAMPALSPTMTEGNIATWRVKEGDSFAAGDVLLEIETDKATMDVEAQEDGLLMKITQGDGSKAVQVGTRIGVLAEPGDDLGSLELPPDDNKAAAPPPPPPSRENDKPRQRKEEEKEPRAGGQRARGETTTPAPGKSGARAPRQTYPLLPSVMHLVHAKGLDEAAIADMTPTGPNGRLLKGDVLAYLGSIGAKTPAEVSARFEKQSHLDLSGIKVARPAAPAKQAAAPKKPAAPAAEDSTLTQLVSLAAVIEVQKKVHDTLGVFVPLSTFVARATELANDGLPPSAAAKPSADELFDQVLGLDTVGPAGTRGHFLPQISALPPRSLASPRRALPKADIIDILAGAAKPAAPKPAHAPRPGLSTGANLFTLKVAKTEEQRAQVFLQRVKGVLEGSPGSLVL